MTYLGTGTFGGPTLDVTPPGAGNLAAFRDLVAAVLDLDPDVTVHPAPVDAVSPPCYVLVWPDPWLAPRTVCAYVANLEIVCIAARLDPAPGYGQLEALVASAIPALRRAGIAFVSAGGAVPLEVGGLTYQAARILVSQSVTFPEVRLMALTVVNVPPFILTKPILTVGDPATNGVQYECGANEIDASPEQDSNDTETFCGIFTSYKPAKWTVTVTALQSFGAAGLWNTLRPMVNTIQPFSIVPDASQPIGPDNVAMTGEAYIPEFAYLTASVGEASEFDFVLAVQGDPVFDDTAVLREGTTPEGTTPEGTSEQTAQAA